jgi:pimeloyl-ACP methyl ester carboxylesterase
MLWPALRPGYGPLPCTCVPFSSSYPLTALISSPPAPCPTPSYLVLLGGLSDSSLPTPYTLPLANMCKDQGWHFANPSLRSSALQFGFGSLDNDAEDLADFLSYLSQATPSATPSPRVVLVGHSTGCQQIAHLLRTRPGAADCVVGAVLQAGVSDRETTEDNAKHLEAARAMIAGGSGDEFMPRAAFWAPITAARFEALFGDVGEGDSYFCSDMEPGVMRERLAGLRGLEFGLYAYSMEDEYVPPGVDRGGAIGKVCEAGGMEALKLEGANHNLSRPEDGSAGRRLVEAIREKLEAL